MNPVVSILDKVFKGRQVLPSTCISGNNAGHFLIVENGTCSFEVPEKFSNEDIAQFFLNVLNPHARTVYLWAIDGCFMTARSKGERCDCALFSTQEFCFIEFKTNAQTAHPKSILEHREKAIAQLRASIEMLIKALTEKKLSLGLTHFEAYICSPPGWPSKNAGINDAQIDFLESYGFQ